MEPVIDTNEYLRRLESLGYSVKIDEKNGSWVAQGRSTGKKNSRPVKRVGESPEWALLALYNHVKNQNMMMARTGAWKTPWHNMGEQIARSYAEMPTYDSEAVPYYQALANESGKQADAIRNQISVERTHEPDPYKHIDDLRNDIHHNQHLYVSTHELGHPIWNKDQSLDFRIAHNLAHAQAGADHTWIGRNQAVAHHLPQLTPPAREALFTERIGKPAYWHHYDGNAPHKIGLMPEYMKSAQEQNGEHLHVPHGGLDVIRVSSENIELPYSSPATVFVPFD